MSARGSTALGNFKAIRPRVQQALLLILINSGSVELTRQLIRTSSVHATFSSVIIPSAQLRSPIRLST